MKTNRPTTILTGFLGAGKTTYLNHMMERNQNVRYAIIENEFGEQGIDSELVIRPEDGIIELNNGCLCCTLHNNLFDILNALFERKDEYDEIIIEATGVADPAGLAEPFVSHPAIKEFFPLSSIICLVDAELVEEQLQEAEEAMNQLTFSDVLLINKTDLVSEEQVASLQHKLSDLNPLAKIVVGNKSNFPTIDFERQRNLFNELEISHVLDQPQQDNTRENFPVFKPHVHHHHEHTEEVVSHSFVFDKPFHHEMLYQQMFVYLTLQSKGLYRMKGLVWLADSEKQHVMQSVGKRLDFHEKRTWEEGELRKSTIVFIGKNLKRAGLEKLLNRCFA
ncbi:GTP-binding protein [Flammeovirgaceae bacterium SG7u.111]|nr:GTP-binding protein [Flammeovirgaceae bacterium SG7u.132]WPO36685.1 GTP-binding protein [Flammeovirgaceae bacterium SG7u.111]